MEETKNNSKQFVKEVKKIILELNKKKAINVKAFNVKNLTILCDYIIIASANNKTHVKSLADYIEIFLKENNKTIKNIEKDTSNSWIIIDCFDIIINIFYEKTREFYNLEGLWSDGLELCCF